MITRYLLFFAMGGAIQGFLLALYFIFSTKGNRLTKSLLASIIAIFSYVIVINVLLTNGDLALIPHLSFTQSALAFLLAPLHYLLIDSLLSKSTQITYKSLFHLIPFVVFVVWAWSYFGLASGQKHDLIHTILSDHEAFLSSPFNKSTFYWALIVQLISYLVVIVKKVYAHKISQGNSPAHFIQALILFYVLLTLTVIFRFAFYYSISSAILLPILISLGLYGLSLWTFWADNPLFSLQRIKKKYQNSSLSKTAMKQIADKMIMILERDQLFLEKDLSLQKLASYMNTTPHSLSQTINLELHESYVDLVNRFRVQKVISRITSEEFGNLSIEGIAMESGFRSKSSFYRAFKKHTGLTPSMYLKNR